MNTTRLGETQKNSPQEGRLFKTVAVIAQLGGEWLGFEVEDVVEVLEPDKICPVPTSPTCIKGITNFRGEIVTVVNLGEIIKLSPSPKIENIRMIVVKKNGMNLGLIVDAVDEICSFEEKSFSKHSVRWKSQGALNVWNGIFERKGRIINMVDLNKICGFLDSFNK